MRDSLVVCLAAAALCSGLAGCRKPPAIVATTGRPATSQSPQAPVGAPKSQGPHEKVMIEMIAWFNDAAEILEGVKDPASGKAVIPKFDKHYAKLGYLLKRHEEMGDPPKDEETALEKKHGEAMELAITRLKDTANQAKLKGGPEFNREMRRFKTDE